MASNTKTSHAYNNGRNDSTATDNSSILTSSSTSSTAKLLKEKILTKKPKALHNDDMTPGEKQRLQESVRINKQVLAMVGSLR